MNEVKFLGIEEIEMVCQFCGKREIGKAFVFQDLETGNIVRYGSQCSKKALGYSTSKMNAIKAQKKAEIIAKWQKIISDISKEIANVSTDAEYVALSIKKREAMVNALAEEKKYW